ncbi:MAG: helix-turn-helix transcriptional regulator [Bacilli bacterium]
MNNVNSELIGSLIKKLRKENDMTLIDLANVLNVSKPAVSQWENGKGIKTEYLYSLSKFFNISMSELLDGKLNEEDNESFWKRNYDITNYDFEDNINEKNINNVKDYYVHYNMIKNRFYNLLPKWANDQLKNNEVEEFIYLKNYFEFDYNYKNIIDNSNGYNIFENEKIQKEFVKKIINKIDDLSSDEYNWELIKLYNCKLDLKGEIVCKSGNMKAFDYMLNVMTQVEKDVLLEHNLYYDNENNNFLSNNKKFAFTNDEIEQKEYFKIMLNNNCNCMLDYHNNYETISDECLNYFEGKIKINDLRENENINNIHLYIDSFGRDYHIALRKWKSLSYKEYCKFIDYKKTKYLKNLVNNKDSNPLKYFEELINIDNM